MRGGFCESDGAQSVENVPADLMNLAGEFGGQKPAVAWQVAEIGNGGRRGNTERQGKDEISAGYQDPMNFRQGLVQGRNALEIVEGERGVKRRISGVQPVARFDRVAELTIDTGDGAETADRLRQRFGERLDRSERQQAGPVREHPLCYQKVQYGPVSIDEAVFASAGKRFAPVRNSALVGEDLTVLCRGAERGGGDTDAAGSLQRDDGLARAEGLLVEPPGVENRLRFLAELLEFSARLEADSGEVEGCVGETVHVG